MDKLLVFVMYLLFSVGAAKALQENFNDLLSNLFFLVWVGWTLKFGTQGESNSHVDQS